MGWFDGKGKSESYSIDELLNMKDSELNKIIKKGQVPQRSPKELRAAAKVAKRAGDGEKGLGALRAASKGGGTGNRNYQNVPLKERVHPARYKEILEQEAKRQGLL